MEGMLRENPPEEMPRATSAEEAENAAADLAADEVSEKPPEVEASEVRAAFVEPSVDREMEEEVPRPREGREQAEESGQHFEKSRLRPENGLEFESRTVKDKEDLERVRSGLDETMDHGMSFAAGVATGEMLRGGRRASEATEVKYRICERCGGSGRRWIFFKCPLCKGKGQVVASHRVERSV